MRRSQRARRLAGAIFSASRYLATVRRATWMPCSASICASWLSDSGALGSSAATSCRISARTAVLDALPPASVDSDEPKKYFSSKVPYGVDMYLAVVTREMVDSCRPSSSAISRSTSGFIAIAPCVKKPFCRSTMACDTRTMVSKRCWMFLTNQRASCSRAARPAPVPLRWPRIACAYRSLMRSLGITSGLSSTFQPRPTSLHDDVGHDHASIRCWPNGAARLGFAAHDQLARLAQLRLVGAGGGGQLLELAPRQQVEVLPADRRSPTRAPAARAGAQLQRQALGQVARADAGRLQALQPLQRALQALEQLVAVESASLASARRSAISASVSAR